VVDKVDVSGSGGSGRCRSALTEEQKSRRNGRKDREEAKKGPKITGMFAA
jgi:hypothetical protein